MTSLSELGAFLQRHREDRGWSLDEAEEITHIRRHYIEAMEAGDWDNLPPAVYTRGLLRNYARALGISQASIMRMHAKERPHEARLPEPQLISQPLVVTPRFNFELIAAIALLLISAGLIAWVVRSQLPGALQSAQSTSAQNQVAVAPALTASTATPDGPTTTPYPTRPPRVVAGVVTAEATSTAGTASAGTAPASDGTPDDSGDGSGDGADDTSGSATTSDATADAAADAAADATDDGTQDREGPGSDGSGASAGTSSANRTATAAASSRSGSTPTATPRTRPTAGPSPTATIRVAGTRLTMTVSATSDAWIQVLTDGEVVYRDFLRKGQVKRWWGKERVGLRSGNAGGTVVKLNEQELEPLGDKGEVVEYEWRLLPSGDVEQRQL